MKYWLIVSTLLVFTFAKLDYAYFGVWKFV